MTEEHRVAFGPNKNPSESSRRAIDFGLGTRINGHAEAPRRASGRDRGKPRRKPLEPTKTRDPPNRINRGRPAVAEEGASPQQTNARRKPNQNVHDRKEPGAKRSQQGRDRHHDEGGILAKNTKGAAGSHGADNGATKQTETDAVQRERCANPTAIQFKGCERSCRSIWKTPGGVAKPTNKDGDQKR